MSEEFPITNNSINTDRMFGPSSYLSSKQTHDQDLTFSSDEVVSVVRGKVTPNSSASSAEKIIENDENSKRDDKGKRKKQQQARFAFMTKSEVDHLEDGYRWRKYGQKAVKNSSYPRSYYRCTTQGCLVKKHVERSFEDPSVVVTTYEGQHNHHIPVARMYAPSPNSFSQELGLDQMRVSPDVYGYDVINNESNMRLPQQQLNQFPEHGLLQDIIPPVFPAQEPSYYSANINQY